MRRIAGFSLIEIMVVVLIVGLLAAISYPAYLNQVRDSRRAEGKALLTEVMQRQERFFTQNNTYTDDLDGDLDYADDPARSENDWYRVSAGQCGGDPLTQCVELTAAPTPGRDQTNDDCGNLTFDSRGRKDVSGSASADSCW